MIEKSRLEELIEQGATIWHDDYGEIQLNKGCEICEVRSMSGEHLNWVLCFEYEYNNRKQWEEIYIEELEENVKVGKWKYEMHTSRMEYFKPPIWEEFEKRKFYDFQGKDHRTYYIQHLTYCDLLVVYDNDDCYTNQLTGVVIDHTYENTNLFKEEPTKENYIKAVEYARKLFEGEKE